MTEQERPRTEAGRRAWDDVSELEPHHRIRVRDHFLAIEAEGRQQAVRLLEDAENLIRSYVPKGSRLREQWLSEVAGLNPHDGPCEPQDASESPPPCPVCGSRTKDHDGFAHDAQAARYNTSGLFDLNGRPASESPLCPDCGNDMRYAGHPVPWRRCGDASESPPTCKRCGHGEGCSTRCCMNTAEPCNYGDASESGQPSEASDE